ncbi:MAG: NAD(P)-binding domain-containing protein, partial [Stellaceae bacterium]
MEKKKMKESTAEVAFLGIGLMCSRMARNLLAARYPLTVWNRNKSKADSLAAQGAIVADSAAAAVRGADAVITMLANGP